jgi:phosphoglycolate phosphatase-like HAD superfamily hydrolase
MDAVICDIDGTLADNAHRRHYVERPVGEKDWTAFFAVQHLDPLVTNIALTFEALSAWGMAKVICTGRGEEYREVTEAWLANHGVAYEVLLMRPEGNRDDDGDIKRTMLEGLREAGYDPKIAIDDRNRVVAMWRSEGLTCLQVADGDF